MFREVAVAEIMSDIESNAVLRRKAREGRQEHQARAMSPAKALRVAIAKAADDVFGLNVVVTDVAMAQIGKPEVSKHFEVGGMLLLLEGRGESAGAVSIGGQIVAALIEQQTIGSVTQRQAPDRAATRVDAAMAAPLIDRVLQRFETLLSQEKEQVWAEGYQFGAMLEDVRGLDLAMDAHDYHLFQISVEINSGAKSGMITLLLPERVRPVPLDDEDSAGMPAEATLGDVVLQAAAEMTVVLTRLSLPYDKLRDLKAGQVLPLASDALGQAALEAGQGQKVALVTLGQLNGLRAVRLRGKDKSHLRDARMEALPDPSISATLVDQPLQAGDIDTLNMAATSLPELPDLPDLPDLPKMDGLDQTPALMDMAGMDDLSDLPDLGDLPDLMDLEDLPDLAAAGGPMSMEGGLTES